MRNPPGAEALQASATSTKGKGKERILKWSLTAKGGPGLPTQLLPRQASLAWTSVTCGSKSQSDPLGANPYFPLSTEDLSSTLLCGNLSVPSTVCLFVFKRIVNGGKFLISGFSTACLLNAHWRHRPPINKTSRAKEPVCFWLHTQTNPLPCAFLHSLCRQNCLRSHGGLSLHKGAQFRLVKCH